MHFQVFQKGGVTVKGLNSMGWLRREARGRQECRATKRLLSRAATGQLLTRFFLPICSSPPNAAAMATCSYPSRQLPAPHLRSCALPMIVDSRKTRESCSPLNWILSWSAEIEIALHHCYFSWRDIQWQESNQAAALWAVEFVLSVYSSQVYT